MEHDKSLEYKISYKLIEDLDEAKKEEGYFDYHQIGNNMYSIVIDKNSRDMGLAKKLATVLIPHAEKIFLNRPDKKIIFEQESFRESDFSDN